MEYLNKTIFCDIDGTLVYHDNPSDVAKPNHTLRLLPYTLDKLLEWNKKGYVIILTTGRRESMRHVTERQLREVGIFYDQLIMGVGRGPRIIINDAKEDGIITAQAICIERNKGLHDISL